MAHLRSLAVILALGVVSCAKAEDGAAIDAMADVDALAADAAIDAVPTCSPACEDNDLCTNNVCNGTVCAFPAISCDDADMCTTDSCAAATGCAHAAMSCDDADMCTTDSCDSATGCAHAAVNCDDGNPCTVDTCAAGSGCLNTPMNPTGTQTFSFIGGDQTFTVPACETSISITAFGAQGSPGPNGGGAGGNGGRATGTRAVTPGQLVTIVVGGQNGFNGGGSAGGGGPLGGVGGGASDVRIGGGGLINRDRKSVV